MMLRVVLALAVACLVATNTHSQLQLGPAQNEQGRGAGVDPVLLLSRHGYTCQIWNRRFDQAQACSNRPIHSSTRFAPERKTAVSASCDYRANFYNSR